MHSRAPRLLRLASLVTSFLALSLHSVAAQARAKDAAVSKGHVEKLDELGLTITLPAEWTEVTPVKPPNAQVKVGWTTKFGASDLVILLYVLPNKEFGFEEPEDVNDLILDNLRERGDKSFAYEGTELLNGAFGFAPYAALGWGPTHAADGKTIDGGYHVLGGLLPQAGYSLEVTATPPLDAANEKVVLDFLRKGVAYSGKPRNAQWTDEEVKARWASDAPDDVKKKMEKPLRTKHYVFMSDTGAVKQMADSMEGFYITIQKTYPFPEVAGRKLMPVFLFQRQEDYYAFYAAQFDTTVEEARSSKGVASRDFYATYYDAPQDPVHIHEMTHQIFSNRLRLGGGGSWFQEGVAEYICTKPSDRVDAANSVKKGRYTKLAEFVDIKSLLGEGQDDKKGGGKAGSNYALAALLIEFVRESKWSKDKFLDWVHAIGHCPANNTVAIERATQATLGVDLAGLEAKWVEYCKKR